MLPEKTWKAESVVRLMLGVFSTLSVGVLLAGALANFATGWAMEQTKFLSMIIITVAFHGAALLWIKLFLKGESISWAEAFGFRSAGLPRVIRLAILSGILVLPVAWGLQQLSALLMEAGNFNPKPQQVVQEMQKGGVSSFQQVYLGLVALIAAPIVEEMLFRGILYPTIKQAGYRKLALWGTSILFALTHQNVPAFLPLVFFAIILTLLYEETGNLLAPIIAHSCFNTANFILLVWGKQFLPSFN